MARLKTLKDATPDSGDEAQAPEAGPDAVAGEPAQDTPATDALNAPAETLAEAPAEPVSGDTQADAAALAPTSTESPYDETVAALTAQVEAAHVALEAAHAEFLDQSDKLAAANARAASLEDEVKAKASEIDLLTATVAQRDAQIAALGSAPPPLPAEASIHRPAAGDVIDLPEEDGFAKWPAVAEYLDAGELVVMVLTGDKGDVQPFAPVVGGKALFTVRESGLLYAGAIALEPEAAPVSMRHAVLLDAAGTVLSVCRMGALLLGGGDLSAMIPGNNLRFGFN